MVFYSAATTRPSHTNRTYSIGVSDCIALIPSLFSVRVCVVLDTNNSTTPSLSVSVVESDQGILLDNGQQRSLSARNISSAIANPPAKPSPTATSKRDRLGTSVHCQVHKPLVASFHVTYSRLPDSLARQAHGLSCMPRPFVCYDIQLHADCYE